MNLLDRSFYAGDPYPALARLRAAEPVHHDEVTGLWALLRHADVVAAEKRPEVFSSAAGSRPRSAPQPSMIDSDDPQHRRRRGLVAHGFNPHSVAELEARVRNLAAGLIDTVAARGECDLVADIAAPLPALVIAEMLGLPLDERARLQRWSDDMIAGADGPENATPTVLAAFAEFVTSMNEIIEGRRRRPRDDVISQLVHGEIDGERLGDDELIGESLLILIGGLETTRNVISGGMLALLDHPEQAALLAADPASLPRAVEECIRWVTPVINMARTTTRDVEVRGRKIPKGDQVLLMYISANRDEEVFERPDAFDVTREPNQHVSFGMGAHFCLGASLARLEARVMVGELLRRLPGMRRAEPQSPPAYTSSSFVRGLTSLPVAFTPAP